MKLFKATALLLLQFSIASATPITIPTNGLVAHYPLNGNMIDVVGGFNGSKYGSTPIGATNATFNGRDDYMEFLMANPLIENKSSFSITYWILRDRNSQRVNSFLSKRNQCGMEESFDMRGRNTINFENLSPNNHQSIKANLVDRWQLITFVKDGNNYKIYRDYYEEDSGTFSNASFTDGDLSFSNSPCITSQDGTSRFKGKMDEILIYDRPLNRLDIRLIFTATNPRAQKDPNQPIKALQQEKTSILTGDTGNNTSNKADNTVSPEDIVINKDGTWRFKTKDDK